MVRIIHPVMEIDNWPYRQVETLAFVVPSRDFDLIGAIKKAAKEYSQGEGKRAVERAGNWFCWGLVPQIPNRILSHYGIQWAPEEEVINDTTNIDYDENLLELDTDEEPPARATKKDLTVEEIYAIAERLEISTDECRREEMDFHFCSDAGEDFRFCVWPEDDYNEIPGKVREYAESFNPEEHAREWYHAGRGEPESLKVLLDDAKAIKRKLIAFADALELGIETT